MSFILRLFYLSSQIALTRYIFYIYCHWPIYIFSGTPVTCYLLIFGKLVVNPVQFLLPEIIQRDNQGIIVYFNYIAKCCSCDKLVSRQSYNAVPFVTMEQKKKLQLKHKNSLFMLQTFHYNYHWWFQSLLNRFGWEIYAFQR